MVKASLQAFRKITVLIVSSRVKPRALALGLDSQPLPLRRLRAARVRGAAGLRPATGDRAGAVAGQGVRERSTHRHVMSVPLPTGPDGPD